MHKSSIGISEIINDCTLDLCVPTYSCETLASILKKICANSGAGGEGGTGGCCYTFTNSSTITFQKDGNIISAATIGIPAPLDSGNLAPLFTTDVATASTTPFLSFNLNLQGANRVFIGPPSGANAYPSFRLLTFADLPFTVGDFIQNQTDTDQVANWRISGHGQVGTYLQINDSGRFKKTTASVYQTNLTTLADPVDDRYGMNLAVNKLYFHYGLDTGFAADSHSAAHIRGGVGGAQFLDLVASDAVTIYGPSLGFSTPRTASNPNISVGGLYPLKLIGSNTGDVGIKDYLDIVNGWPAGTNSGTSGEGTNVRVLFSANRTTGGKTSFGRMGIEVTDFSNAAYKGDLIFETGAATHGADPYSGKLEVKLRIRHDGVLIGQRYSTLLTAPVTTGTTKMLINDENGLVSWANIPAGASGSVTSVALSMPSAFSVANSPITTAGTLIVTALGTTNQVVRGDGTLGGVPISSLAPATLSNTINSANLTQEWQWNSLTTNPGLYLHANTSTFTGTQLLKVLLEGSGNSGINSSITANNILISSGTNIGVSTNVSGGTNNYGTYITSNGTGNNFGLYTNASGGSLNVAAFFDGGDILISSLSSIPTQDYIMGWESGGSRVGKITPGTGIALSGGNLNVTGVPISGLLAATANNNISNGAFKQNWNWTTLADGPGLTVRSTSTVSSGISKLMVVDMSGAHTSANRTSTSLLVSNTHSGTGSVNYGVYATAVSGSFNVAIGAYAPLGADHAAIAVEQGNVRFSFGDFFLPSLTVLANQDYLLGTYTGGFSGQVGRVGIGTGLTLIGGVLSAVGGGGGGGSVTSVGLSMPSAFTVTNSPITTSGTLAVTGAGTISQYIRGDGSLATFAIPISSLLAATATNTIDSLNFAQIWNWSTLAAQTGLTLQSNSTAASSNTQTILSLVASGANANASQTTYGLRVSNSHTGTGAVNYAASFDRGVVGFGTVGVESGVIEFRGATSGTITVQPASAAGTYTLTLPTTDGNSNEVLTTNGAGVLTWSNVSATPQTFQQTLTTGSTLTGNNTVAGAGFNFIWNNFTDYTINATGKLFLKVANYGAATPGDVLTLISTSTGEVNFQAPGAGSSGTVTSFSAGDLSPLFTTTEATVTTTPALTFTLTNAGANTWFGNVGASPAAPSYNSAGTFSTIDDTNVTATITGTAANSLLKSFGITLGWTGTLGVARGGTNIASYAVGDILQATGTTTLSKLPIGTNGQLLRVNAGGTALEYFTHAFGPGTVTNFSAGDLSPLFTTSEATTTTTPALTFSLTSALAHTYFGNNTVSTGAPAYRANAALSKVDDTNVTLTLGGAFATSLLEAASITVGWNGTLGVARGGTNISSYTVGDILRATASTTLTKLALGTANQLLRVNAGGTDIEWYTAAIGSGSVTSVSSGDLSPLFTVVVSNPSSTPAFTFSLTSAGANTYFGNATGSPTSPSYTAAGALTTVSDTNIVITAGGNSATSLLRAASITASWSGTLGVARGGTNIASYTVGDILMATGATTLSKIPIGGALQQLRVNAGATSLEYFTPANGITTLNTLTAATQTFATGTSGTDFNIASSTSTHTFNIPDASLSNRGLVTTGAQSFAGTKTFDVGLVINNSASATNTRIASAGNANAFLVDSGNNRIGIFTTTPGFPLDVTGNTRITGNLGINASPISSVGLLVGGSGYTTSGLFVSCSVNAQVGTSAFVATIAGTVVEAASGTSAVVGGLQISPTIVTAGLGSVTDAASLLISGPTVAIGANSWSLLITSGNTNLGGSIFQPTPNAYTAGARDLIVRNQATGRYETADPFTIAITNTASTGYQLVLADREGWKRFTSNSAITVTVPTNGTVAFPIGTVITIKQEGTGQITITPAIGVTLQAADGALKSRVQFSVITLVQDQANIWSVSGDTTV